MINNMWLGVRRYVVIYEISVLGVLTPHYYKNEEVENMTKDQVLLLLKQANEYLSGETMSKEIGVSRAAIHTAVKKLRSDGYEIESVTNKGYRLVNSLDCLTKGEILSFLSKERKAPLFCHETIDSTNLRLKKMASEGAESGTVVVANEQTAGRGRLGRSFVSDKNTGIYLSMLIRPTTGISHLSEMTAWVAVCVARAIEEVTGVKPGIKWVNDVVINKKKVCGILTELSVEAESGAIQYVVVGIGINVHNKISDFPEEIRNIASSVDEETNLCVNRAKLAAALIENLDEMFLVWPNNKELYLKYYREQCVTTGKQVRLLKSSEEQQGFAIDVTDDFHLLVKMEDGQEAEISSGEVSVRGMYNYID